MEHPDLDYLNLKDLKSVCKYYKIEHASRVKRVELEALIFMAEHVQAMKMMHAYNSMPVTEEELGVINITPDTSNNSPE
jgi:hypothetical protein